MRACTSYAYLGLAVLLMAVLTPSGQPADNPANDFRGAGAPLVTTWAFKRLAPPSPLYVTADDVLRVAAASSQASEVVTVNYRLLAAFDQRVHYGQFTVKASLNSPVPTADEPLTEGFLLSASCSAAVASTRGQTFARLMLNPKALGQGQPAQMLMADYVTTAMAPGFPNGRVVSPVEGPGYVYAPGGTDRVRGIDWSEGAGVGVRRRIIGLRAVLTTSATAGTRLPFLQVRNTLFTEVISWTPQALVQPSTVTVFVWSSAPMVAGSLPGINQVPLPDNLIVPVGYTLTVTTLGLDTNPGTGDQWTGVGVYQEEWLDNV